MSHPLRIGISACILHPDPDRALFNGRQLQFLERSMADWVMRQGALAYLIPIPAADGPISADDLIIPLDGVILHGGADVSPGLYGEEPMQPEWGGDPLRDAYELGLVRACLARDLPVLGICRGAQLLNVALGGSLYQDITTQHPGALRHRDPSTYQRNHHEVVFPEGSSLSALYQTQRGRINSVHHQAVKTLGAGLVVEATSAHDGVIEAIRLPAASARDPFALGVQWHPEFQTDDEVALLSPTPLFDAFARACHARR